MLIPVLTFAMMQPQASVCDIRNRPSAFIKQILTIHSQVVSAFPHGIFLQDDKCPKIVLLLGYDLPDADATVKNLIPAIMVDCSPDAPNHKTHGDFTGRVVSSSTGHPEFRLKSVSNLDNTPCPPPIKSFPPMHP